MFATKLKLGTDFAIHCFKYIFNQNLSLWHSLMFDIWTHGFVCYFMCLRADGPVQVQKSFF